MRTPRPAPPSRPSSLLACSLLLALVGGCASRGTPLEEVTLEVNSTLDPGPWRLAPGDTLSVHLADKPDWDQTPVVRADGRASFLLVGELELGGLTLPEAEERVRDAYERVLPGQQVSVDARVQAPRRIYVIGEVHSPGEFTVDGRVSLIEGLALAGGPLKRTALLQHTLLVRWVAQERRQMAWRIDARIEAWDHDTPLLLQPYDVVFVPNTPIDNVNIWIDQWIRQNLPFPFLFPPVQ